MAKSATAHIGALALHDALAAARNPTMLTMLASCVAIALVYSMVVGTDWMGLEASRAFLATMALSIAPAFVGSVITLYDMSEEYEAGASVTLAQAGVTPARMVIGKLLAALVWTVVTVAVLCVLLGFPYSLTLGVVALSVPVSLPLLLLCLALGLVSDGQERCSVYSVPIVVVALIPMLSVLGEGFRQVACYLPMGFVAEAASAMTGAQAVLPVSASVALLFVWLAAASALVVWAYRGYAKRIADAVERV